MTMTINLPEATAEKLAELLPESERELFAASAVEAALAEREAENRLANDLLAEENSELEDALCRAAVEEGFAAIEEGEAMVSLEDARIRWEKQRATSVRALRK